MRVGFTRTRKRIAVVVTAVVVVYGAGYIVCRLNKSIVHYTATAGGKCSFHGIAAGDCKIVSVGPALEFVYTPLRYAEILA